MFSWWIYIIKCILECLWHAMPWYFFFLVLLCICSWRPILYFAKKTENGCTTVICNPLCITGRSAGHLGGADRWRQRQQESRVRTRVRALPSQLAARSGLGQRAALGFRKPPGSGRCPLGLLAGKDSDRRQLWDLGGYRVPGSGPCPSQSAVRSESSSGTLEATRLRTLPSQSAVRSGLGTEGTIWRSAG